MNRKLVNGLLLLSVATVGCGTFTSCKDTDEDFKNEVLLSQDEYYKRLIAYIDEHQCDCPDDTKALLAAIRDFLGTPSADGKYPNGAVEDKVKALINGTLEAAFGENYMTWKNEIGKKIDNKLDKNDAEYVKMGKYIVTLNEFVEEQKKNNKEVNADLEAALARANEAYKSALEANNVLTDLVPALEEFIAEMQKLQPQIDALKERLNKLITSILTQQTYNPIFGSINLPIGLQSNVVANYYGYTDHEIEFPFGAQEYNGNNSVLNNNAVITAIGKLGYKTKTVSGYYMSDDNDNNLGTLYVTINPNNINFDGSELSLVNSKDDEVLKVTAVKDNETILNFGYTRANNGFYAAKANIEPEKAPDLAIHVEDGLKSAMKDALLSPSKQDFVALGKVLLNQMTNVCPAYALKASWKAPVSSSTTEKDDNGNDKTSYTTEEQEFAVYSQYNIAAATVHPLGYEFLYGEGTNKELPTFGRIQDAFHEFFSDIRKDIVINLTFDKVTGLNPDKIKIDLSQVKLKIEPTSIKIDLNGTPIEFGNGQKGSIKGDDAVIVLGYDGKQVSANGNADALNPLIGQIVSSVNELLGGKGEGSLTDELNEQIRTQIVGKVNEIVADINNMLVGDGTSDHPGINGQINNQIGIILDNIEKQLAGKLNSVDKLVDKYNALAKKINNFLKNPNHYLQVMMAYETKNGGLHQLSNSYTDPSLFVQAGGNSIELFATSYTAELIAPSYLKFVAVTRAWNGGTEDAEEVKRVNDANKYLNEVRPGRQQRFGISGLKSNYKYEIVYTSLDYRGYTSTNLYYLTVE